MFESIPDYREIVVLLFLFQIERGLSRGIGFSERDINRLNLEFKYILTEQHEDYLYYVKNEKESNIEKSLKK